MTQKMKRAIKEERKRGGRKAHDVDRRNELEDLFSEAVDKTRAEIFRRKMK